MLGAKNPRQWIRTIIQLYCLKAWFGNLKLVKPQAQDGRQRRVDVGQVASNHYKNIVFAFSLPYSFTLYAIIFILFYYIFAYNCLLHSYNLNLQKEIITLFIPPQGDYLRLNQFNFSNNNNNNLFFQNFVFDIFLKIKKLWTMFCFDFEIFKMVKLLKFN